MDELRAHVEQPARTPRPPGSEAHAQAQVYIDYTFLRRSTDAVARWLRSLLESLS